MEQYFQKIDLPEIDLPKCKRDTKRAIRKVVKGSNKGNLLDALIEEIGQENIAPLLIHLMSEQEDHRQERNALVEQALNGIHYRCMGHDFNGEVMSLTSRIRKGEKPEETADAFKALHEQIFWPHYQNFSTLEEQLKIVDNSMRQSPAIIFSNGVDLNSRVPSMLGKVLVNLCSNALHHGKANEVKMNIGDKQIIVSDNGSGVPEHLIKNDKLFRLDITTRAFRGGYGLFFCREYMRRFGGNVSLIDKNTFEVKLV